MQTFDIIEKLNTQHNLSKSELIFLLDDNSQKVQDKLLKLAQQTAISVYGNKVYTRGLIEFSNICKNDCLYCGIRRSNQKVTRYRLSEEEILSCCNQGYSLGFRTFVLQGGEDLHFTADIMSSIVSKIKKAYPDCAITLSLGEKTREYYEQLYNAGADRYLLRHETATKSHYEKLHPATMSFDNRMRCLNDLKDIGYQVGCGFMVGSPYQTVENLAEDLLFIKSFKPHMVGIGPFISQSDTPFHNQPSGTLNATLKLLSIIRLLLPTVLLPATTALGTIHPQGREKGILSGANVVMPNLSPTAVREKYLLYDNKICTGDESAQCIVCLTNRMKSIGYQIVSDRGDNVDYISNKE